jgi:hypothetical protein
MRALARTSSVGLGIRCPPRGLAEAAILLCAFPQWAIWLSGDRGDWAAMRLAEPVPPGPEAPMVGCGPERPGN